jgi:hypothetical protein
MKRRLGLAGFVVALAIAASACGSGTAAVSIKTLQAAVSNTQAAESSRFTVDVAVNALGHDFTVEGEGVSSGDGKAIQLTLTVPIFGAFEVRVLDDAIYVDLGSLPVAAARLPDGKHWVRFSLDALGAKSGTYLAQLFDQVRGNSPRQGLEYLQGLSGDVQNLGDDTVAGVHATHYRASIDFSKVAAKLPASASALAGKLSALGTTPADVWIDDQDRVVKMHFVVDGSAFGAGGGTAEFTMQITDFGVPVEVQAPPADETVDLFSLDGQSV